MRVLGESGGVDDAGIERLIHLGRRHRSRRRADRAKRLAEPAGRAHAHAFEIRQRSARRAFADDVVLRHRRRHQQFGVPAREIFLRRRMRVDRFRDGQFLLERGNAQKRQLQHGDGRVFVAVITGAKLRHLKRADRDAVEIFAVFESPP